MKPRAFPLICFALLSGCAATGLVYQAPSPPPDGYATLIIYRAATGPGGAWPISFSINFKENVASLKQGGYTIVSLRVSNEKYAVREGSPSSPAVVFVDPRPGETFYVRFGTMIGSFAFSGAVPIVQAAGVITKVTAAEALREIATFKLQPATVAKIDGNL